MRLSAVAESYMVYTYRVPLIKLALICSIDTIPPACPFDITDMNLFLMLMQNEKLTIYRPTFFSFRYLKGGALKYV